VEERIGSMYFQNSVLDEIRQQVLKILSKDGNLDKTDIRNHFVSLGLEGEFDKIVCTDLYIHAAFARPESTLNEAKKGWDDTFSLCQNENIRADIKDASGEFVEEPSLAGFERLKQLFDEGRNSFDNDNI
jgi:DNA primase